jgi:hypothetical protein
MDMSHSVSPAVPVDTDALAEALAHLGLLYGGRDAVAAAAAQASDESEAVRNFITSERSHLLATYAMDDLVALVMAARNEKAGAPASIETYCPV